MKNMLLAWKANLDIQIVLEPYGCATYIVGYISKSQRGMSAQLDAAAKEARKGNLDLKKQVRHIGNVFSNSDEVSAQEAVYLSLQIPLTKSTRDVVFVSTSASEERVFLLKPKSSLDDLPAESTDIESDGILKDPDNFKNSAWLIMYPKWMLFIQRRINCPLKWK